MDGSRKDGERKWREGRVPIAKIPKTQFHLASLA
jgi:hypothetical protein